MKFRIADPKAIRRRLTEQGAAAEAVHSQVDCYLGHPCRDFAATDEALRIRTIDGRRFLTYKGPVVDGRTKTRKEIEIALNRDADVAPFEELFLSLGFRPVATVRKDRQPYRLERNGRCFELALDFVPPLGWFLEIELLAEMNDLADAQQSVVQLAQSLGLDEVEEKTYLELVLANLAEH
jgi:adenylate cyclase class 2